MKYILLWVWQFPQHLVALVIRAILKPETYTIYNSKRIYWVKHNFGVSLGNYIFLNGKYNTQTVKHEYGHSIQSEYLGFLYLIVVGIPSAIFNNLWDRLFHKKWPAEKRIQWYYNRYPEKWADELGDVKRNAGIF